MLVHCYQLSLSKLFHFLAISLKICWYVQPRAYFFSFHICQQTHSPCSSSLKLLFLKKIIQANHSRTLPAYDTRPRWRLCITDTRSGHAAVSSPPAMHGARWKTLELPEFFILTRQLFCQWPLRDLAQAALALFSFPSAFTRDLSSLGKGLSVSRHGAYHCGALASKRSVPIPKDDKGLRN